MEEYGQEVRTWVQRYLEDKFAPTPLSPAINSESGTNGKSPRVKNWATQKITEIGEWKTGDGTGLILGSVGYAGKGALVCSDQDSTEAVTYGDHFLPETGMISGREAKPSSNRFYIVSEKSPSGDKFSSARRDIHVEILGQGHQIVVPPTVIIDKHGNFGTKIWYKYEEGPAHLEYSSLLDATTRLAVFCELVRIWPKAGRHRISLPLAGGLLRAGWPEEEVIWAIDTLGTRSGWDVQPSEVENAVRNTADKLEQGESRVTGWPALVKELGGDGETEKSITRILGWLRADTDDRPAIEVRVGHLDRTVTKAWHVLRDANDPVSMMRFSNEPVRIERMDDRDQWGIVALNTDRLRYHTTQHMSWYKKTSDGERRPLDPPIDVIRLMLAAGDVPLPILDRIVTAPVFSPSGVLQTSEGYHPEAKTYYAASKGLVIPDVVLKPGEEELDRARELILDNLMADFSFAKQSDRAHALALLLLPFARDLIAGPTPMHIIDANIQGAGKTLLASAASMPFTGGQGAIPTGFPTSEEEMSKTILALLAEGRTHVNFDNVVSRMSSAHLALAITANNYTQRKLGVSETLSPPVRCVWMATANQATGDTDVIRRSIHIRLVSKVENPHLIPIDTWKHFPLKDWVSSHRGELIWACLTFVQKWIAEGMVRRRASFGDFGDWAGVIGGILDAVYIKGFLDDITDFQLTANEDRESWQTFYADLWHRYGPNPWPGGDVLPLATGAGLEVRGRDHDDQKRELGAMLRSKLEVIHGGLRLQDLGKPVRRGSGRGYYLEAVDGRAEWTPEVKGTNTGEPIKMAQRPGLIKLRETL